MYLVYLAYFVHMVCDALCIVVFWWFSGIFVLVAFWWYSMLFAMFSFLLGGLMFFLLSCWFSCGGVLECCFCFVFFLYYAMCFVYLENVCILRRLRTLCIWSMMHCVLRIPFSDCCSLHSVLGIRSGVYWMLHSVSCIAYTAL